ncbi:hypothetical protein P7K49_008113 [Saguinus oedipus]|uniref:Uncharacterized protein n=1 Tax=Saguinus oedipus TaxID=9490 RepID=A0ABQ9VWX5_SAGOE|nr:hypothetical protein P7K49_008113 [Saguinus oedipus]
MGLWVGWSMLDGAGRSEEEGLSRSREAAERPENFQRPSEVGQDSTLGDGGENGYDVKLETILELNVIEFLFYLG